VTRYLSAGTLFLALGSLRRALLSATAGVVSESAVFRFAAFGAITLAGIHMLMAREDEVRRAASASERERLAHDLHDGLCQDLAFIASSVQQTLGDGSQPIVVAARRALATSRGVMADLSASTARGLRTVLREVADELSQRFGILVDIDCPPLDMPAEDREHLVRIVREAIVNAAVHGRAHNVSVLLKRTQDGGLLLSIADDGRGVIASHWREGFGMTSMRRHAALLGGHMSARPGIDGGVELEVVVPLKVAVP